MGEGRQITVEPLSFAMTGFKVEDVFSKEFMTELKKECPTAIISQFLINFADTKGIVFVSHDRREGKVNFDRVDVEGSERKLAERVVEVLKRVFQ